MPGDIRAHYRQLLEQYASARQQYLRLERSGASEDELQNLRFELRMLRGAIETTEHLLRQGQK
uniref:ARAD1B20240p n=1 Tax=Blastobotrys adeninivorans TaxID=409370 RepID=A0A060TC46_BLAAD